MTMVQMNVRIDAKLKNEVEEVLKGKGVSVSDVIRSLWLYIADRKEVPALETTAEEQAREEEKQRKLKLIREGAGYVHKELVKAGLISKTPTSWKALPTSSSATKCTTSNLMRIQYEEGRLMTDVSMQRILLDTNVLLDYLLHRDDHAKMAEAVMELGAKNNITLLCASLSLKDIAYLSSSAIRREFKPNESEVENFTRGFLSSRVPWRCIEQVKEMCDIVAVDESTCDKAFSPAKTASGF